MCICLIVDVLLFVFVMILNDVLSCNRLWMFLCMIV